MPSKEVRAQTVKLRERKFGTHGFLDGDNVNVFITHVLDELTATTIMAEAADVPEEGPHYGAIGGLLDPRTREALCARRAVVRERVRPRISPGGGGAGRRGPEVEGGIPSGGASGGERRAARASASFPSRISRARMAAI